MKDWRQLERIDNLGFLVGSGHQSIPALAWLGLLARLFVGRFTARLTLGSCAHAG